MTNLSPAAIMNPNTYISTLPESEREALALCGIAHDRQLAEIPAAKLAADLAKARKLFPGKVADIALARLQELCCAAAAGLGLAPAQGDGEAGEPDFAPMAAAGNEPRPFQPRQYPKLEIRSGRRRSHAAQAADASREKGNARKPERSIHCVRPVRIYVGALATILLVVDIALCVVMPIYLIAGGECKATPNEMGLIAAAAALPYIFYARRACCPVCNMKLFTLLSRFPHNKQAHRLPILGYTIATALHIIFRLWFHCPACGTAQRLLHRSHSSKRH